MEISNKSDNQNDNWRKSFRISSSGSSRIMMAITTLILQICLLLLRAHFNRNTDTERSIASLKEAQSKLAALAAEFETKLRYSAPSQTQIDHLQDLMDEEIKKNEDESRGN
jgi:hypothetical protein